MSITPTITFVYDRYKKASKTKAASIELRITFMRKQKYISTGIQVYPKQWKNGTIVNRPDDLQLNQQLNRLLVEVRQVIIDMEKDNNIDIFSITNRLSSFTNKQTTMLDFFKKRAAVREYGSCNATKKRYDRFIRFFSEWGGIKSFKDITEENIIAYDEFLKSKNLCISTKWHNYHRFLNSFIIDAIDANLIHKNPYKWLKIPKGETDSLSKCLTAEEFDKIKSAPLPTLCLQRVRDVFVFQTYTCLSYIDLSNFDVNKISEVKGMKIYIEDRNKTGKKFVAPLFRPALDILNKYGNKLPIISNEKYNDYLKVVAQAAGIDKPISSHWARHTGATLLLNAGIPMQIVSKICGHSSIRITEQVYAKLFNETVVDAIMRLNTKL